MQFDYLTLSIKFDKSVSYNKQISTILDVLHLADIWEEFSFLGRSRFYAGVYRYNDISVSVPAVNRADKQGFCISFSSSGLGFYLKHLNTIDCKLDLRKILQAWRALGFVGNCVPRVTRVDVCHDDIAKGDDEPLLSLHKIQGCYNRGELRSQFRRPKNDGSKNIDISDNWAGSRSPEDTGRTIYFGNKKSSVYCRFYDKAAEQRGKGAFVPDDINSWVRCEYVFKDTRAMAVVNYYMDNSDDDFVKYMSGVFNYYLSFIVLNDKNRSRCSLKRWWYKFIKTTECCSLSLPEYKNATFAGTSQWLNKLAPTLYAYIECVGLRRALKLLEKYGKNPDKKTARIKQMQDDYIFTANNDFNDGKKVKPIVSLGLDPWVMTNKDKDLDRLMYRIEKEYKRFHSDNGVAWEPFRENEAGEWVAPWKREKVSAPAVHQLDLFNVSDYAEFWQ